MGIINLLKLYDRACVLRKVFEKHSCTHIQETLHTRATSVDCRIFGIFAFRNAPRRYICSNILHARGKNFTSVHISAVDFWQQEKPTPSQLQQAAVVVL